MVIINLDGTCRHCGSCLYAPLGARVRCKHCHHLQGQTTMCGRCGMYLTATSDARSVRCALCHAVTRVQRRTSGLEDFLKGLIYSLMWPGRHRTSIPGMPGRKRALLIGIGYTMTKYEIKGSVNDVNIMGKVLRERFGFPSDSILMLTEEEKDPERLPTRENIRQAMRWLVRGCDSGDAKSLVFHFSGHGFREALCPLDFEGGSVIPDSEINKTIVRPLGPGVKLHAFVDTDNIDTIVLDLPYRCRILRTGYWQWESQDHQTKGTNGGLAISISGCRDSQNPGSYAVADHPPVGAMTYNLIKAMESEPGTTYGRLIQAIRAEISQEPQLRASEEFDIYKPFLL